MGVCKLPESFRNTCAWSLLLLFKPVAAAPGVQNGHACSGRCLLPEFTYRFPGEAQGMAEATGRVPWLSQGPLDEGGGAAVVVSGQSAEARGGISGFWSML